MSATPDFSLLSLWELFVLDLEGQIETLQTGLLAMEQHCTPENVAPLMRAMHSIKSAARVVELDAVSEFAHQFEDRLLQLQDQQRSLAPAMADHLLACVDVLQQLSALTEAQMRDMPLSLRDRLRALASSWPATDAGAVPVPGVSAPSAEAPPPVAVLPPPALLPEVALPPVAELSPALPTPSSVRVNAEGLSRILGLAGEIGVRSSQVRTKVVELLKLKRQQDRLRRQLDALFHEEQETAMSAMRQQRWAEVMQLQRSGGSATEQLYVTLEDFDRRLTRLASRLGREALSTRMRPLGEGLKGVSRLVRDVARTLAKQVSLTLRGVETPVDRDTLEKLQNPINHLLRNAVDHGIEMPDARVRQGKPAEGQIIIRASHHAGMLSLQIEDDGAGIDLARLRQRAVERGMMSAAQAAAANTEALLDLLFLPGFSTRQEVSQVSGRGVGLDVVREMVREVGGIVRVSSVLGRATTFHLMLPMTRAVVRALLVLVAGEPYAFPLARLDRVMRLPKAAIQMTEGRQFFLLQGEPVGISWAGHALSVPGQVWREEDECALVILGEQRRRHALIVDRYIGERSLVVRPLDPRLGTIPGIQAAAILDDGVPILLVDVDGVLDWLQQLPGLHTSAAPALGAAAMARVRYKRVLLAEDTLVLREFLRHSMATQGYEVHAVPDGVQAWQALQQTPYDLLVTDIEMPEMDGFSLLQRVRQTGGLRRLPVIICSSHAEESYRLKGLELGADAYVVKQGLNVIALTQAVEDLIGQA